MAAAPAIPAAPWHSMVDALLWLHPAAPDARDALPPRLTERAGLPITMGGLISYRCGPVGPYGEIFGAPVMVRGGWLLSHVAFMAVDSERSVAGGRGNWALPKELATFDGDPGTPGVATAGGEGWRIRVMAAVRVRRFPFGLTVRSAQVWPEGRVGVFCVRFRGRARLARVVVEHVTPSRLSGWLAEGEHPAVLVSGTQDVSRPCWG